MNEGSFTDNDYSQPTKKWSPGHVYLMDYGDGRTFKIGHTRVSPEVRMNQIAKGNVIMPMSLVMSVETDTNAFFLENILQMTLDQLHVRGEWFELDFCKLIGLYQCMNFFGHVKLYDRWFELVPEDYNEFIKGGSLENLPFFTRKERDDIENFDISSLFNRTIES